VYNPTFRPDPQPTQGQRFVPIEAPAQVDNPPPRNIALAMGIVLSC